MAYNNDNAQAFRTRYRDAIHPLYNPWLHAAFVLAYGLTCVGLLWRTLDAVATWQWLLVPLTLVFFSWGEYQVHKRLGTTRRALASCSTSATPVITTASLLKARCATRRRATGG